jgi:hypothetical protein
MLKHCVFFNFKPDFGIKDRTKIFQTLASLTEDIPGMLDLAYGDNLDFENKSSNYNAGFVVTFTDRVSHLAYEAHPVHVQAGAKLIEMCNGGYDGIMVFDVETDT